VIRVADDGSIRVTIPRWGSKREATAFVAREWRWIEQERGRLPPPRAPADPDPELRSRATRELPGRLMELAREHGLTVTRVSIRKQKRRWGSCSRNGHICLNWRLVQVPDWVRDYVMVHELMHLKRMDHSPKFWRLVAAACPRYQDARRWLRAASFS
jgi:predicted metal-dependent hydrolase